MRVVATWEEIERNLDQLDKYRLAQDTQEGKFYKDLIQNGICFVVYETSGRLLFGPSRFVGYANNNLDAHQANETKDGRETNPAISKVLGEEPIKDERLEDEYRQFCARVGVIARPTGKFGVTRKYWLVRH